MRDENSTTDLVYLKVRFNFDVFATEDGESIAALPGVIESGPIYPDDPALYNIYIVTTHKDDAETLHEQLVKFAAVDFVEYTTKPEPR